MQATLYAGIFSGKLPQKLQIANATGPENSCAHTGARPPPLSHRVISGCSDLILNRTLRLSDFAAPEVQDRSRPLEGPAGTDH
jgi:hypothetical protein